MKKFTALLLSCVLILTGCASSVQKEQPSMKPSIMEMTKAAGLSEEATEVTEELTAAVRTVTDPSDKPAEREAQESAEELSEIAEGSNVKASMEIPPDGTGLIFTEKTPEERQKEISDLGFTSLDDPDLLRYVEDDIYAQLVNQLDSTDYFVENIEAVYISKEYLDELEYNSLENIFFGYTLSELEEQFVGTKYVFTLGKDGQTIVQELEEYDDTFDKVIKNVAIGTGVILICVTVSVVSGGAGAPAVSMIFAASAKSATIFALSSGTISGVSAGVVEGIKTNDFDQAIKAAAVAGSEGYKWGAFSGAISGGASEAIALKGATLNGLTMNEAAAIQKESKYPLDVIKQMHSMDEYKVYKEAGLKAFMVDGKTALIKDIDLDFISELPDGRKLTNLQRMQAGMAPIDPLSGKAYHLHHIGQKADATLAVLNPSEHLGNASILNTIGKESEIDRLAFQKVRNNFWKYLGDVVFSGGGF